MLVNIAKSTADQVCKPCAAALSFPAHDCHATILVWIAADALVLVYYTGIFECDVLVRFWVSASIAVKTFSLWYRVSFVQQHQNCLPTHNLSQRTKLH
jgi:hypothetical protein